MKDTKNFGYGKIVFCIDILHMHADVKFSLSYSSKPFLEDEAPILGLDLLSLTSDDWHKILEEKRNLHKCPSVIKVRRLLNSIARLKSSSQQLVGHNGHAAKPISKHASDSEIVRSSDDEELDAKASTCVYCHSVKVKRSQSEFKPERWKTLLAFLYALMVSWVSAFGNIIQSIVLLR